MNKNLIPVVASLAAMALCSVGWALLPILQDSHRAVESEASVEVERARRLLDGFDVTLVVKSLLSDQFAEEGIEADPESLTDDTADDYQQIHTALWDAYTPTDWRGDTTRPARANYGNIPQQIREGLAGQKVLIAENEQLLQRALDAVGKALSIKKSGESSRTHAEANRLKSVIVYHMGRIDQLKAQLQRREAAQFRRELVNLASAANEAEALGQLVADSQIGEAVGRLEQRAAELDAKIEENRGASVALDATIRDLEARALAAEARAEAAHREMSELKASGIDFSDPNGAENFQIRLEKQDVLYRKAAREAHELTFGDYPKARIDWSSDYLHGKYVENGSGRALTIEYGLLYYRDKRAVLAVEIDGRQRASDDLRSDIARLESMKNAAQASLARARQRVSEASVAASDVFVELNRIESEAFAIEESALALLDRSLQTAKQAAGYADRWLRDAGDRTRGLSTAAKGRSAHGARLRDGWMGGYAAAQEADARLAKAWIYYARYDAYTRSARLLASISGLLHLAESDAESERAKANDAREAGIEEIKTAMGVLKRVHGKVEGHWTVTAQAAGTTYLLALFGHQDYVGEAIEAYRAAIRGRENKAFATPFVSRLSYLEGR